LWFVVGLGNPGEKYTNTRHNFGFRVVDSLSREFGIEFKGQQKSLIAEFQYKGKRILLCKPLTYMNLSGVAVSQLLRGREISLSNLIVIHDDLDLPLGRIRIKKGGSSGGHRGVQSIIDHLSSQEFIRVRLGIGRPIDLSPTDYVLEEFSPDEESLVEAVIKEASEAVLTIISDGLEKAMSFYNSRTLS
jgi:PTH1 family peptidyl-tRNA hydrolase